MASPLFVSPATPASDNRPSPWALELTDEERRKRRTKIVATLGPSSIPKIRELIIAGVNVFRLNFSHITDPVKQILPQVIEIRKQSRDLRMAVAILADMSGPKIRCGDFDTPSHSIPLAQGQRVRLLNSTNPGTGASSDGKVLASITTPIVQVVRQLQTGHRLMLDDGQLLLRVVSRVSQDELICEVQNPWELKSRKGINVPDIRLDVPAVTEKDRLDLRFAWDMRVEYVAESFVQRDQDVVLMRDILEGFRREELAKIEKEGLPVHPDPHDYPDLVLDEPTDGKLLVNMKIWRPQIIAKIETPHGLEDIDSIINQADGIMVARGDLGVEIPLPKVPLAQKMLIARTNAAEKPVITATQMLESMIEAPNPTRAEVSDVANAVFDGTDAVMLSAETATGKYPIEAVRYMSSIARHAELSLAATHTHFDPHRAPHYHSNRGGPVVRAVPDEFGHAIADSAVAGAEQAKAEAIVVFTATGYMARLVSKRRPTTRILAVTGSRSVYRRLQLVWGVTPIYSRALRAPARPDQPHDTAGETSDVSDDDLDHDEPRNIRRAMSTHAHALPSLVTSTGVSTELVLAQAEREVVEVAKLAPGSVVVMAAGFFADFPGLSCTIRIARVGDVEKVITSRAWGGSLVKLSDKPKEEKEKGSQAAAERKAQPAK